MRHVKWARVASLEDRTPKGMISTSVRAWNILRSAEVKLRRAVDWLVPEADIL